MQQITQSAMKGNPFLSTPSSKAIMQYSQYGGVCFGVVMLAWPIAILFVMSQSHVKRAFEEPAN